MWSVKSVCTHVCAGCGVWGGKFLCHSRACGWMGPAASCSSLSLSPPSPPGWCKSEEGTSLSVAKRHTWITQFDLSVGGKLQTGRWEHAVLHSLRQPFISNNAFTTASAVTLTVNVVSEWVSHLDVDEQLPQVTWRHHQGRVQLGDVAFVQSNVVISCEALEQKEKGSNLSHV